jgi:hypothetical protein
VRPTVLAPLAALLPALLLGACAGRGTEPTATTQPPLCSTGDGRAANGVLLIAQSVPTSSWVPCLGTAVPLGWSFTHLDARNGTSRFSLDSDRDGPGAIEVLLEASCDNEGATEIPSDREGMRRLERVVQVSPRYVGKRYYDFDGGCLTFSFRLDGDSPGEALALASQVVGAVTRDDLSAQVRAESGGRLSLDPAGDRGDGP